MYLILLLMGIINSAKPVFFFLFDIRIISSEFFLASPRAFCTVKMGTTGN